MASPDSANVSETRSASVHVLIAREHRCRRGVGRLRGFARRRCQSGTRLVDACWRSWPTFCWAAARGSARGKSALSSPSLGKDASVRDSDSSVVRRRHLGARYHFCRADRARRADAAFATGDDRAGTVVAARRHRRVAERVRAEAERDRLVVVRVRARDREQRERPRSPRSACRPPTRRCPPRSSRSRTRATSCRLALSRPPTNARWPSADRRDLHPRTSRCRDASSSSMPQRVARHGDDDRASSRVASTRTCPRARAQRRGSLPRGRPRHGELDRKTPRRAPDVKIALVDCMRRSMRRRSAASSSRGLFALAACFLAESRKSAWGRAVGSAWMNGPSATMRSLGPRTAEQVVAVPT